MTPTEHDTVLLDLVRTMATAEHRLANSQSTIMQTTDQRLMAQRSVRGRRIADPRTFAQALHTLQTGIQDPDNAHDSYHAKYTWPKYLERYLAAREAEKHAIGAVLDHELDYTGWSRFWLVTSSPGHVHKDRACHTCKATTTYALVPTLSGSTEHAAVDMFGPAMCSVCFPSAPTGLKISTALAESVGTDQFSKHLAKHQAKMGAK